MLHNRISFQHMIQLPTPNLYETKENCKKDVWDTSDCRLALTILL